MEKHIDWEYSFGGAFSIYIHFILIIAAYFFARSFILYARKNDYTKTGPYGAAWSYGAVVFFSFLFSGMLTGLYNYPKEISIYSETIKILICVLPPAIVGTYQGLKKDSKMDKDEKQRYFNGTKGITYPF